MKKTIALFSLMIGCQDTDPNIPNNTVESLEDPISTQPSPTTEHPNAHHEDASEPSTEDEIDTEPMPLPDLLTCASESTGHLDFFGIPYAIQMVLLNVYSTAHTTFFIDHVHPATEDAFEGGMVGGEATYQSLPEMGFDSIAIELSEAHRQVGNLTWLNLFQGNGSLNLIQVDPNRFSGVLSFPHDQNMRPELDIHCWVPQSEKAYHYDPDSGLCLNTDGEEGYNLASQAEVRETGVASA